MNKKLLFVLLIGVVMTLPIGQSGTPDYGRSLTSNPTIQSYDPGEDTTRLLMGGGANSRSGRWLWATGFESGKGEFVDIGNCSIDSAIAYQGKSSLFFSTNAVNGEVAYIYKTLFIPTNSNATENKVGTEIMFAPVFSIPHPFDFEMTITTREGAATRNEFKTRFTWTGAVAQLYYIDNTGASVLLRDISEYIPNTTAEQFHVMKLVVDVKNKKFIRFIFDDLVFDMNVPGQIVGGTQPQASAAFYNLIVNRDAFGQQARVDNWIITGDEP